MATRRGARTPKGVAREERKAAGKPFSAEPTGKATHYKDVISLPGEITLSTARSVLERIRQYGWATPNTDFSRIEIEFEADDDWDLREQLAEIEQELSSYGVDFTVDKAKMTEPTMCHPCPGQMCRVCDDDPAIPHGNPLVTNQKPGAPEPLTSEEEAELRALLRYGDHEPVAPGSVLGVQRRLLATLDRDRAALSHPESDTRGLREALRTSAENVHLFGPGSHDDGEFDNCRLPICAANTAALSHPESDTRGLRGAAQAVIDCEAQEFGPDRCEHIAALRTALSHPESDTRGLDVERLATALDNTPTRVFWRVKDGEDRQGLVREWAANISAAYARLSASPGLSIDREGHHDTDDCFDQPERHHPQCPKPGGGWCNCGAQQDINREVFARHAAIRGTTQPEPTE